MGLIRFSIKVDETVSEEWRHEGWRRVQPFLGKELENNVQRKLAIFEIFFLQKLVENFQNLSKIKKIENSGYFSDI